MTRTALGTSPLAPSLPRRSEMQLPVVSFVIPVRDDAKRLKSCLESIARSEYPDALCEIVVVDNGSIDDSARVAHEAGAHLVRLPSVGIAALRNRGAEVAVGEVLAFVDADHTIAATWLLGAAAALRDPAVAAVGAPCDAPITGTWVQRMYGALRGHASGSREATWLGSGNMAVRRGPFRQIGGFDTTLETCEDVDLCQRLRAAGYRLISDERLKSIHLGDPSTLRALFVGELWRGRDNLRTAFRHAPTLRDLPSILIPVVNLGAFAAIIAGCLRLTSGWKLISVGVAICFATSVLRTSRMMAQGSGWTFPNIWRAFSVAAVYEAARALAIVTRARHHRVARCL